MKQIGTPNNKAVYHRLGMIADDLNDQQEKQKAKGKFKPLLSSLQIKALEGQMKVQDIEIKRANLVIKSDAHNRTFGANIEIRNVESKKFDEFE